jgi:uncharacterized protein YqhQ
LAQQPGGDAAGAATARSDPKPKREDHLYGGQAVIEGVMMRGRDHWAVAVRRADGSLHVESHDVKTVGNRFPFMKKPGLRGVLALGQALSIGMRALTISANQAAPEEDQLTKRQIGISMGIALLVFVGVFVAGPAIGFKYVQQHWIHSSIAVNLLEGVFRVLLFLGYLALIGRMKDIRRVFEYHGAEHKTIAAYEHHDVLEPAEVDKYSTLHVRCGTNFLLIVMILTIFVFALFGNPPLLWRVLSRIVAIPLIAGIAYELLRLGAKYHRSLVMRAVMAPGLWLQKITTKPPDHPQIEVAIASFQEVLRAERAPSAATVPDPAP